MTTPTRIFLCSNPVRLDVELRESGIEVLHRGDRLSQDPGLQIVLESEVPVTMVLRGFVDADGTKWTVTAVGDALNEGAQWNATDDRCISTWGPTEGRQIVVVMATNAAGEVRRQPIFIEVLPEGAKPYP